MKKRFPALVLVIILLLMPQLVIPSSAAETITQTLNIADINKNDSGSGYNWANIDGILTMDNLRIETEDDYGLTLPANATIVLKGNNYIKASRIAIRSVSSLTIEGNGTLTLLSDDIGILCASNLERDTLRFRSGEINITAANTGVYSEYATISLTGADINVSAKDYAFRGKNIQALSGTVNANGRLTAETDLTLSGVDLTASGSAPVLSAGNNLKISSCDILCGSSLDSLSESDKYTDTASVKLISTVDNSKKGVLFGGSLPLFVDYIVFTAIGLVAVAVIAVPIYIKSKKTKKLIAEHQAMLEKKKKAPKKK